MSYLIVMDSGGDANAEMASPQVAVVPLTLIVDDEEIIDNEDFDQQVFLAKVAQSKGCPRSNCPSPGEYLKVFERDAERIYVVTLSSMLSGSYGSACAAAQILSEARPGVKIHVFDSKSASAGEALVSSMIMKAEAAGLGFNEVVADIDAFIAGQNTCFVLEDLTFLQKNGRLSGIKSLLAGVLNIVPIMCSTAEGSIRLLKNVRGYRHALDELLKHIVSECTAFGRGRINVSHCNGLERAAELRNKLLACLPQAEIHILKTRRLSSLYAGNHGLVVSY